MSSARPSRRVPAEPFPDVFQQDGALFAELRAVEGEEDGVEGVVDEVGLVQYGDEDVEHGVQAPVEVRAHHVGQGQRPEGQEAEQEAPGNHQQDLGHADLAAEAQAVRVPRNLGCQGPRSPAGARCERGRGHAPKGRGGTPWRRSLSA